MIISESESLFDKGDPIKVKVIDFNVAIEVSKTNPRIRGGTGLREWSAPETYKSFYSDFKIDSWTLGCVMYLLCTGQQPFEKHQKLEESKQINFEGKLSIYKNSESFSDMVDFMSRLIMVDPVSRLSSQEALNHPWLRGESYQSEMDGMEK